MPITPTHYMLLSAALFIIGVIGVMVRRNIIIIFMSIELILNAAGLNFVAFEHFVSGGIAGQVFTVFVVILAASEAAIALAIVLQVYRGARTIMTDGLDELRE